MRGIGVSVLVGEGCWGVSGIQGEGIGVRVLGGKGYSG